MKRAPLTSNGVIDELAGRRRFITATHTRRGLIYSLDDTMRLVPAPVVERMVAKGILIAADALPLTPPPCAGSRCASPRPGEA